LLSLLIGLKGEENFETIIWINCITNPIVVGTTNLFYMQSQSLIIRNIALAMFEISVVFVEGFLFKKYLKNFKKNPYKFSLYLNALSFGIGLIINYIINN